MADTENQQSGGRLGISKVSCFLSRLLAEKANLWTQARKPGWLVLHLLQIEHMATARHRTEQELRVRREHAWS